MLITTPAVYYLKDRPAELVFFNYAAGVCISFEDCFYFDFFALLCRWDAAPVAVILSDYMDVDAAKLDKRALAVLFNTGLEDVVYDIVSGYEVPETNDYCSGLLYLGSLDSSIIIYCFLRVAPLLLAVITVRFVD